MSNANGLELLGLLTIAAISVMTVGVGLNSHAGNGDTSLSSPLIKEAKASPVGKPAPASRITKSTDAEAPIYLDLGARF